MKTKGSEHTTRHDAVDAISASHILHPHRHFDRPEEVVSARLSSDEKRAILASWASDLHAVRSLPELRHPPGLPVRFDTETFLTRSRSSTSGETRARRRGPRAMRFCLDRREAEHDSQANPTSDCHHYL